MADTSDTYTLVIHEGDQVRTFEQVTTVVDTSDGMLIFRKDADPVIIRLPERIEVHELTHI